MPRRGGHSARSCAAVSDLGRAVRPLGGAARRVRHRERGDRADRRDLARCASDRDGALRVPRPRARCDRNRRPGARRARARRGRCGCGAGDGGPRDGLVAGRRLCLRRRAARPRRPAPAGVHRRPGGDRACTGDLGDARAHAAGGGGRLRARRDSDRRRGHALSRRLDAARRAGCLRADRHPRARAGLGHHRGLGGPAGARRRPPPDARPAVRRRPLGDRRRGCRARPARSPRRARVSDLSSVRLARYGPASG